MRKPRNLERYIPRKAAAASLRKVADDMEQGDNGTLVSWYINVNYWNPAWATKPKVTNARKATKALLGEE